MIKKQLISLRKCAPFFYNEVMFEWEDDLSRKGFTIKCRSQIEKYFWLLFISTGISKSRFCLAGYPKDVEKLKMKDNKSINRIMVMLARDSFRNSNNQLIGILSKFSDKYEFNLKLHPSCDYNYYSNLAKTCNMGIISQDKTIGQCLNNTLYDLSIAVNTTAYYDSLIKGVPCLRYSDGTFDLMCGLDQDYFSSADEFEKSISFLLGLTAKEYQKKVDDILKYAIGLGIDNYSMILL